MFRSIIINLITNILIQCFAAIQTGLNWLENMAFLLMLPIFLTTRALGELYWPFFPGDRRWFVTLDPSFIEGIFLFMRINSISHCPHLHTLGTE